MEQLHVLVKWVCHNRNENWSSCYFVYKLVRMNCQRRKSMFFFFFIPQCHSMCKVFLPTRRIVLGFHRCYCPVRTCGCPFLWVQHSRTHSWARRNTSLDSSPRQLLSQFISRDPWVFCLILVPWNIRCGRTSTLPWPLQNKKKRKRKKKLTIPQPSPMLAFNILASLISTYM